MSFYQELPYPVIVATGSVLTSGGSENLKPGQVALLNSETYNALGIGASSLENPEVVIGAGSWHTKDSLTRFIGGLTQSIKSQEFLGKDVVEFHKSAPKELKQDVVQIGWDGVNDCDSLNFECGKSYFFKVSVQGEDVFRTFSRPLYRFIHLKTECCPDTSCEDGDCSDPVNKEKYTKLLAKLINEDPELKYFVKAEAVLSNYAATTATYTEYTLPICDNGDIVALAAVQAAYPNDKVTRKSRADSTSVYSIIHLTTTGTPAAFTPTSSILQAVCGTCPSGYTSVAARDVYIVKRPITPTTDLDDATSKATYAATIVTAYSGQGAITGSGKFLGTDDGTALVQISFAAGTTVTVASGTADIILLSHSEAAVCTPPAGSAVTWTAGDTFYRPTRTLCVTINKNCGTTDRLTDIEAFYAGSTDIVPDSIAIRASGECADTYELEQYSDSVVEDGCLSPAEPVYKDVQSFEGFIWKECPCIDEPGAEDPEIFTGVRLTGAYQDTRFGNCSFEVTDYFSQRPVRINISEVADEKGNPCSVAAKVTKLQYGQVSSQSGEWLVRQYLKSVANEAYNIWANDPRLREVYDQQVLSFIDRNKLYDVYYIVYKQNRDGANWNTQHTADKFETIIAFPQGTNTATFEQIFGGYFSQFGVFLKNRGE